MLLILICIGLFFKGVFFVVSGQKWLISNNVVSHNILMNNKGKKKSRKKERNFIVSFIYQHSEIKAKKRLTANIIFTEQN